MAYPKVTVEETDPSGKEPTTVLVSFGAVAAALRITTDETGIRVAAIGVSAPLIAALPQAANVLRVEPVFKMSKKRRKD